MKKLFIKKMTFTVMFSAVITICSWISVPFSSGISVSLQSFAVMLASYLLGAKMGLASVLIYLSLGAVGIPVFAGGRGGFDVLFGTSGGFLFGFLILAIVVGACRQYLGEGRLMAVLSMAAGLVLCYTLGTLWFYFVYSDGSSLLSVAAVCILPYLPFDALKIWLAVFVSQRLKDCKPLGGFYERKRKNA